MLHISARPYCQHACQHSDYLVNVDFSIHYTVTRDDGRAVRKYITSPMFILTHSVPEWLQLMVSIELYELHNVNAHVLFVNNCIRLLTCSGRYRLAT